MQKYHLFRRYLSVDPAFQDPQLWLPFLLQTPKMVPRAQEDSGNPWICQCLNSATLGYEVIQGHACYYLTKQRTSAQLTPLKNGCRLISFAPSSEPSLFLGSLCSKRYINCFALRLTCSMTKLRIPCYSPCRKFLCTLANAPMKTWVHTQEIISPVYVQGIWDPCEECWRMSFAWSFPWMVCIHKAFHIAEFLRPKRESNERS